MEYTLKELLDVGRLQELLDSLNKLHSLPSAIIDTEGDILTTTAWQDICTKFHRANPKTEQQCLESERCIGAELSEETPHVIYRCPLGLVETATPIIIEGKHLGNIFSGQLFIDPPDETYFIEQAVTYGFDETEYLNAVRKVPIFSEEQLHNNLTFIHTLAIMMAEQALKQMRMLEASEKLRKSTERQRSILQTTKDGVLLVDMPDMSDRKQAEIALNKSEELLNSAMELLPVPLVLNDAEGNISFLNKEFVKKTGYTLDDLRTVNDWWLCAYPDINYRQYVVGKWFLNLDEAKRTGKPFEPMEVKVVCKDGLQREFICNVLELVHDSTITYMVFHYDITERGLAEKDLKHSHELMSYIIQHNQSALAVHDKELRYLYVSQRYLDDYKIKEKNIIGKHHYDVFPDLPQKWRDVHQKGLEGVVSRSEEDSYEREDGTVEWTRWECHPWYEANGTIGGIIIYSEVITERKRAEDHKQTLQNQLQQAQKMESIGRLAGGVAHDFNNMLSVILGHAELGLTRLESDHPVHANLFEIRKSAERSAELTRQLLTFARKQTVIPKVIDLNETVSGTLKMLQRLIGEDIYLNWRPAPHLRPVKIDTEQLDQILANLCVNARDAISDFGTITIETENRTIDKNYCISHVEVVPGNYVRLSVSDDGCGMDKETVANIFEPFYTTKKHGKGTGLGLATVYGAVKQNNGYVDVYSEPGTGTTFTLYLPCSEGDTTQAVKEGTTELYPTGNETVLLVEDESSILNMVSLILTQQGYTVLVANTPDKALQLAREYNGEIHLLMTDVVMPGMNGRDLAKQILCLYPGIKSLYMSGYTADLIAHHGVLDEGVHFIQKPFSMNVLTAKLREALDN